MSLNLGNAGIEAARSLGNNPDWRVVREALLEQVRVTMNKALEAPGEARDDACGYARALRDVYSAFESATTGQSYAQTQKPGPLKGSR